MFAGLNEFEGEIEPVRRVARVVIVPLGISVRLLPPRRLPNATVPATNVTASAVSTFFLLKKHTKQLKAEHGHVRGGGGEPTSHHACLNSPILSDGSPEAGLLLLLLLLLAGLAWPNTLR